MKATVTLVNGLDCELDSIVVDESDLEVAEAVREAVKQMADRVGTFEIGDKIIITA